MKTPCAARTRSLAFGRAIGARRGLAGVGLCALLVAGACGPGVGTIGAVLAQTSDGEVTIHEAPAGLAADRAGLKPGDRILLIDGVDVRALSSRELHLALAGEVDEVVKLTVLRGEEVLRVTVKRTAARRHVVSLPRLGPPAPAASSSAAPSGSVRLPGAEPPAF